MDDLLHLQYELYLPSPHVDGVKARNLALDPRAALQVTGRDFWQYAVAEGTTTLSAQLSPAPA